ncbi:Uma2 family endonuclease [Gammaproteobacteria bacterium]
MPPPALDLYRRHRYTVHDYHAMGKAGIFPPETHVELIDGEIIDMSPIGSPHNGTLARLTKLFTHAVGDSAIVLVQGVIRLDKHSEPQPDLALLRPQADWYCNAHPTAADILLLVEVSDTTLRYDRKVKAPLYAHHDIGELWIIDLHGSRFHRYRYPTAKGYREELVLPFPVSMAPETLPDATIDFSWIIH